MESRDSDEVVVPADPLMKRKAAAELRLGDVLAYIEQAQGLIDRAAAILRGVCGMAKEWERLGALYKEVEATWRAVTIRARRLRTAGRLLVDREPNGYGPRSSRGGCS